MAKVITLGLPEAIASAMVCWYRSGSGSVPEVSLAKSGSVSMVRFSLAGGRSPTAGELVSALGVLNAVVASPDPDTALLVAVGETNVAQIVIHASDLPVSVVATRFVTVGNKHGAKRASRKGLVIDYLSDLAKMTPESFATKRGQTGNLTAIAMAAQQAMAALA